MKMISENAVIGYALRQCSIECSPDHSLGPLEFYLWLQNPRSHNLELGPGYPRVDRRQAWDYAHQGWT